VHASRVKNAATPLLIDERYETVMHKERWKMMQRRPQVAKTKQEAQLLL